jgi:AAA domain
MARDANDVHRELGIDGLRERGDRLPDLDFKDPAPRAKGNGLDAAVQAARFELIPFDKITFDTVPAYLVKGLVPRVCLCVFWGPPKCGKSFLVFDMLMHVALGWKYRDRRAQQGAVVYCALEGCAAFKNRVEAFRLKNLPDSASEVPFHLMASPISLVADHAALIESIAPLSALCRRPRSPSTR